MKDKMEGKIQIIYDQKHAMVEFLKARKNAISWLLEEGVYSDETISKILSIDENQVFLIRTFSEVKRECER